MMSSPAKKEKEAAADTMAISFSESTVILPKTLIIISGIVFAVSFAGSLGVSRYRAAKRAAQELKVKTRSMTSQSSINMQIPCGSISSKVMQNFPRKGHEDFNPVLYATKALGIATGIVATVSGLVVFGGIRYGMGIHSMEEFSHRMKKFWGRNFSSVREAILNNSLDNKNNINEELPETFRNLNATSTSSFNEDNSTDKEAQKWWDDLKYEMDQEVALKCEKRNS